MAAAEDAAFDQVWTSDHVHPWQAKQGHSGQAWIALAALGQQTHGVPPETGVTCPSFRHPPAVVAQAFALVGAPSPGRVFLWVGSGEALNEAPAGGLDRRQRALLRRLPRRAQQRGPAGARRVLTQTPSAA